MKKIMIVEDDKIVSKELADLLKNSNYDVFILEDFENAKTEILKSKCDLILLDINIPYLNGEALLKEIRKESNIPIIMVTSRTSEVDEVLSMSYSARFRADERCLRGRPEIRARPLGAVQGRMGFSGTGLLVWGTCHRNAAP